MNQFYLPLSAVNYRDLNKNYAQIKPEHGFLYLYSPPGLPYSKLLKSTNYF